MLSFEAMLFSISKEKIKLNIGENDKIRYQDILEKSKQKQSNMTKLVSSLKQILIENENEALMAHEVKHKEEIAERVAILNKIEEVYPIQNLSPELEFKVQNDFTKLPSKLTLESDTILKHKMELLSSKSFDQGQKSFESNRHQDISYLFAGEFRTKNTPGKLSDLKKLAIRRKQTELSIKLEESLLTGEKVKLKDDLPSSARREFSHMGLHSMRKYLDKQKEENKTVYSLETTSRPISLNEDVKTKLSSTSACSKFKWQFDRGGASLVISRRMMLNRSCAHYHEKKKIIDDRSERAKDIRKELIRIDSIAIGNSSIVSSYDATFTTRTPNTSRLPPSLPPSLPPLPSFS